jgi:hypothetical protein
MRVQHHAPAALPPGKTRYPLDRRLGGPQGRSGRVREIAPPTGFDPGPSSPQSFAIPTELPGPLYCNIIKIFCSSLSYLREKVNLPVKQAVLPVTYHEDREERVEVRLYSFFNLGARRVGAKFSAPIQTGPGARVFPEGKAAGA